MRRNELKEGIEVKNSKDEVMGTSFVAAKRVSLILLSLCGCVLIGVKDMSYQH